VNTKREIDVNSALIRDTNTPLLRINRSTGKKKRNLTNQKRNENKKSIA
jgi:hypothetical protein